ncbi:MAG TPA: homocysteine S-methyltransferase family protein, partial [Caulobacteraceae bacterium]|nr:homocysteine S-methyltransferase family protein [Caulobacteraceae bacterium]
MTRSERIAAMKAEAKARILILDGSWGVMLQRERLSEEQHRGERFKDWPAHLKGDNDVLCLTQPHLITALHDAYFEAGSDFASTNSFTATSIS